MVGDKVAPDIVAFNAVGAQDPNGFCQEEAAPDPPTPHAKSKQRASCSAAAAQRTRNNLNMASRWESFGVFLVLVLRPLPPARSQAAGNGRFS